MHLAGQLAGIARHAVPRGPMEAVQTANVTVASGLSGDCRGKIKPGGTGRRQISLIEAESWSLAMAEIGADLPWFSRRANLLVSGLRLPREPGAVIAIGPDLRIEVTCECDPCSRMDELHQGLRAALTPDWRGGVLGRVLTDGFLRIGDEVRIG